MSSGVARVWQRSRVRASGTPLRIRLVVAVLLLVTGALVLSAFAATALVRSYSLQQVDHRLNDNVRPVSDMCSPRFARGGNPLAWQDVRPNSFFAGCVDDDGSVVSPTGGEGLPQGEQPPALPRLTATELGRLDGRPFTVSAQGGEGSWRVLAVTRDGSTSVLAQSITDVSRTVNRLILLQVVIGGGVLLVIAGLSYLLVRRSLRPLVAVERTAVAIAAGNLSRRVPTLDPRTEVGRLSMAMNTMLHQIEGAFRQQEKSESAARSAASAARASAESARVSEERMRRFVADASHELRTPLTSIRGFAELSRQQPDLPPADAARFMRRIEDEASRMGVLVEDLLLLARLDQQRPLEQHEVDLLTLAADAAHDARALTPGRPVRLDVLDGAGPPLVVGDEARLRQVIGNLVSNALTHTPPGTAVTVRVGAVATAGGQEALVEVADDGPGLSADEADRVFERFYRADASRTRASGGSGLGLSIVAALVAAHGGRVEVTTTPGGGATFRVRLPLAPSVLAASRQE